MIRFEAPATVASDASRMPCILRVLCYRNRTQEACDRLLALVPALEPPIGICSTWPPYVAAQVGPLEVGHDDAGYLTVAGRRGGVRHTPMVRRRCAGAGDRRVPGAGMGRAGPDGRDHTNRRQEILHGASRARRGQVVPPAGRGGGPARGAAVGCEGKKLGGSRGGGRTQAPVSSAGPGFRGALHRRVSLPLSAPTWGFATKSGRVGLRGPVWRAQGHAGSSKSEAPACPGHSLVGGTLGRRPHGPAQQPALICRGPAPHAAQRPVPQGVGQAGLAMGAPGADIEGPVQGCAVPPRRGEEPFPVDAWPPAGGMRQVRRWRG
jgi:hypothetical protein